LFSFCYLFLEPPGGMSKQKKSFTLSKYSLHLFQVLPPVPSSQQIRPFCLKVIFTRALPRLSGIIAREALSHHNISRRIQVRPARRGLCPRTLRRSRPIGVSQSGETRPQ